MKNKNFCWIATWKVTERCNLHCAYCDSTLMKGAIHIENVDRFDSVKKISYYKPKILNITGGEPSLVDDLSEILAFAKKTWNPYIRVVHNGTGPERLLKSFDFIDRLVISLDGPGDFNTATRGIDGNKVLDRIKNIFPVLKEKKVAISVNTVVTTNNIDHLKDLAESIYRISPEIVFALSPVLPPDLEISILREKSGYENFLKKYNEIKKTFPNVVHNFDCLMRHDDFRVIQCYNQHFGIRFNPSGDVFSCTLNVKGQNEYYKKNLLKFFRKGSLKKAFTQGVRVFKSKFTSVDFTCRNICNCESWFDMVLLGRETTFSPYLLKGFMGRLSDEELEELKIFTTRFINPDFDIESFKKKIHREYQ